MQRLDQNEIDRDEKNEVNEGGGNEATTTMAILRLVGQGR